jgi:hypothetical protein
MLLLLQPWAAVCALAIRVDAQVDRTTIAPGESILLHVTVTDGEGQVDVSNLTGFKVIPRGTSSSVQIINTQMTRETTHNYLLIPQTKGDLTIPALPVSVDGEPFATKPIKIRVMTDPQGSQAAQSREVWVEAELSHDAPYVGQQITYIFRFFNAVNVSDAKFEPPEFSGFKTKEIKDRRSVRKIIDDREFAVTELYYILTPLTAGPLTIEPAALQVGIVKPDRRRRSAFDGFFDDKFFRPGQIETRVLQTDSLNARARPLPPLDPGLSFSGLVGKFELKTEMEKTNLNVGDSATLTVSIQGQGNLMDAQAPLLQPTGDFKAYADSPEEEIITGREGSSGRRLFRTALVPIAAGQFQLPPVQLTYFDTQSESYQTLTADIPTLVVQATDTAQAAPIIIAPQSLPDIKKHVQFTGRDILPLKESLTALRSYRHLDIKIYLIYLLVPMLAYGIIALAKHWGRSDPKPAAIMKARATTALKSTKHCAPELFLTHLYQALTAAILSVAGRLGEALTWQEARTLMQHSGCSEEIAQKVTDLLTEIESLKYSGATLSQRQKSELMAHTRQMVKELIA